MNTSTKQSRPDDANPLFKLGSFVRKGTTGSHGQQLFLSGVGAFLAQLTELLGDRHLGRVLTLIIYTFVPLDDCVRGTQLRQ